jgi:Tol biopolymer transport system component
MRNHDLLRLFKRNRRLTIKPHHRPHRSPLMSGYHFAFFLIASLLLATCSLNRTLAVPLIQNLTPQAENLATATSQPDLSATNAPTAISQPEIAPKPSKPNEAAPATSVAVLASPTVQLMTPIATEASATSTPGVLATSDLLFISDNRLLRWDHVTHYSSSLAENVAAFSTNTSGTKIALLRPRGVAANGNELFDLDLLDFSSKQTRHLIEGTPRLLDLTLSPDGAWLAYQQSPDNHPAIFLLCLSDQANPINLGQCAGQSSNRCTPPAWSPDSQSLLWGDQHGLWVAPVGKSSASQLHTSMVEILDPQGKTSQIEAQFSSPKWSPVGRFALVQVIPDQSNASWHAVIDSLTGRLGQVLDSYKLSPNQVSVSWLPNGKLVVARASDQGQQTPATIQIWDVLATNPALLVSAGLYKFPSTILPTEATSVTISNPVINPLRLDWIQQSNPGHLLFGALQPDTPTQVGLFDLNLLTNSVTQLSQLASDIDQVSWAPDGSGMLIVTSDGQALFISADGKETINLKTTVGSELKGFIWLPPSLRK